MKKIILLITLTLVLLFSGCTNGEMGTLSFIGNGEDFARKGLISKDGWEIFFDNIDIALEDITAYQLSESYDAHSEVEIVGEENKVKLSGKQIIDLAEGDENASPILIGSVEAMVGHYNAVSWKMINSEDLGGNSLILIGTAKKDDQEIKFTIKFNKELQFYAGEYVGDERKGFVEKGKEGNVELTFHFDHLFGDIETDLDDSLNLDALGFEPFVNMADNGVINIDMQDMESNFSEEVLVKIDNIFYNLGHVGEGHAYAVEINK